MKQAAYHPITQAIRATSPEPKPTIKDELHGDSRRSPRIGPRPR
jgi:hypothetical protein